MSCEIDNVLKMTDLIGQIEMNWVVTGSSRSHWDSTCSVYLQALRAEPIFSTDLIYF